MSDQSKISGPKIQPASAERSGASEAGSDLAYVDKPNLYHGGRSKTPGLIALVVAGLLAGGFYAEKVITSQPGDTTRGPSSLAAAEARQFTNLPVSPEEQRKYADGIRAGNVAPELKRLSPVQLASISDGKLRVGFFQMLSPGPKGDLMNFRVNGSDMGVLDESTMESKVPFTYEPGKPLDIQGTLVGGSIGLQYFHGPDGKIVGGIIKVGGSFHWMGVKND